MFGHYLNIILAGEGIMYIEKRARITVKKEGVWQVGYTIEKCTILLTTVKKGKEFPSHEHKESQYGYCFWGEFTFYVDTNPYQLISGDDYQLLGNVKHSAKAVTDFYALDLRYIDNKEIRKSIQFYNLKTIAEDTEKKIKICKIGTANLFFIEGTVEITKESSLLQKNSSVFVLAGSETNICCNGKLIFLKSMEIYEFIDIDNFKIINNIHGVLIINIYNLSRNVN